MLLGSLVGFYLGEFNKTLEGELLGEFVAWFIDPFVGEISVGGLQ